MQDDELLHRFLLGELAEDAAERVEERLLEDDELFDLCEAIEADLLEAAVRGELPPVERERVLNRLASSPQGRARLALARNLAGIAAPRRTLLFFPHLAALTARPVVRWAVAACLVALLGGTTWTWFHNRPEDPGGREPVDENRPVNIVEITPPQPVDTPVREETPPEEEPTPPTPSSDEIAVIPAPEPPARDEEPSTFVVQLAGLLRTGEEPLPEIKIPHGRKHVAFHVEISDFIPNSFDSYSAVVRREDDDQEIWSDDRLAPTLIDNSSALALTVSASKLSPGRYEVEIFGNPAEGDPESLMTRKFEVPGGG